MAARRGKLALALLAALVLILGLTCVASAHAHSCPDDGVCPICQFLNGGMKLAALALVIALAIPVAILFQPSAFVAAPLSISLVRSKIRMND